MVQVINDGVGIKNHFVTQFRHPVRKLRVFIVSDREIRVKAAHLQKYILAITRRIGVHHVNRFGLLQHFEPLFELKLGKPRHHTFLFGLISALHGHYFFIFKGLDHLFNPIVGRHTVRISEEDYFSLCFPHPDVSGSGRTLIPLINVFYRIGLNNVSRPISRTVINNYHLVVFTLIVLG